jgi:uncharacterized protein (TIGR00725 family)
MSAPDPVQDPLTAAAQRQREAPIRMPVAVVGPRTASVAQCAAAQAVGHGIAQMGLSLICGGRAGVMEAACRGAAEAGGVSIGLLPDADTATGNPYATVLLASGLGDARNAVIARAALCLVAIGHNFGTLSEIALARQHGKLVIGLEGAAQVDGVLHLDSPAAALEAIARCVLAQARP